MTLYYTPFDVATVLAEHLPEKVHRVLEPSVGTGVLLSPILEVLKSCKEVVCLDTDSVAISNLNSQFSPVLGKRLKFLCEDFLNWTDDSRKEKYLFDCVLMNPPFSAKKVSGFYTNVNLDFENKKDVFRFVSIETAFILKAIRLLRDGGRLLAILPSSPISSSSNKWLRDLLVKSGSIKYVHELPKYTFPNVDGKVYIFIFEKGGETEKISVCNHRLISPDILSISASQLGPDLRLDYAYNHSKNDLLKFQCSRHFQNWVNLSSSSKLFRGTVNSPIGRRVVLHTTNFDKGYWEYSGKIKLVGVADPGCLVRKGDIVVQRVGRACVMTFGMKVQKELIRASDCTIIIRPKKIISSLRLLFTIRSIYSSEVGKGFLEKGVGAKYISLEELLILEIPLVFSKEISDLYKFWKVKWAARDYQSMLVVEKNVRELILG